MRIKLFIVTPRIFCLTTAALRALLTITPYAIAAEHAACVVRDARAAVLRKKNRSIQIDVIAQLRNDECRRHREAGADHVADHHLQAETTRLLHHRERLGQAATLVELDIHDLKATD